MRWGGKRSAGSLFGGAPTLATDTTIHSAVARASADAWLVAAVSSSPVESRAETAQSPGPPSCARASSTASQAWNDRATPVELVALLSVR